MTSKTAKLRIQQSKQKPLVVFVVFPNIKMLDLSGPLQVFADAGKHDEMGQRYRTIVAAIDGGTVMTDTGLEIQTKRLERLAGHKIDTLIVVGGGGAFAAAKDNKLVKCVKQLDGQARRSGSICTGAFVLAAAGLLSEKRAVTHWDSCDLFAREYPSVLVERDPIFIQDGNHWTSAGVTAGIDLALAMVAEDHGRGFALDLARSLVAYMVRPGGQSQFSTLLQAQAVDAKGLFDDLNQWMAANLTSDLRVDVLADKAHMSPRSFARKYAELTGQTPAKAVENMRLEVARGLLEATNQPMSVIAQKCGFLDDERMRRAFARVLGVSPTDYALRFKTLH